MYRSENLPFFTSTTGLWASFAGRGLPGAPRGSRCPSPQDSDLLCKEHGAKRGATRDAGSRAFPPTSEN